MKVAALKDLLNERNLPITGKKSELVERLLRSDGVHINLEDDNKECLCMDENKVDYEDDSSLMMNEDNLELTENLVDHQNYLSDGANENLYGESGESLKNMGGGMRNNLTVCSVDMSTRFLNMINEVNVGSNGISLNENEVVINNSQSRSLEDIINLSEEQRREMRKKKFGIQTDEEKKLERARRFGISTPLLEEEKKRKRAERFGLPTTGVNGKNNVKTLSGLSKELEDLEADRRRLRALRFGIVNEEEKLRKRAQRFGLISEEEKRKRRSERFMTIDLKE